LAEIFLTDVSLKWCFQFPPHLIWLAQEIEFPAEVVISLKRTS